MSEMQDSEKVAQDKQDVSNMDPPNAELEQENLLRSEEVQDTNETEQSPQEDSADKKVCVPAEPNISGKQCLSEHADEVSADGSVDVGANAQPEVKSEGNDVDPANQPEAVVASVRSPDAKIEEKNMEQLKNDVTGNDLGMYKENGFEVSESKLEMPAEEYPDNMEGSNQSFLSVDGNESGTEEEQAAFMKELEKFFRERSLEFKPPKFYGEGLNCLKLWRAVTKLGGYDQVTSNKLWRQVGESFKPPKTCTTVSWSFRCFYEKALLEYERHKVHGAELCVPLGSLPESMSVENQVGGNQGSGSGRARRDAAARAMQGWHSQRLLGNGEVGDPIIKDKNSISMQKREKQLKSVGLLKRKKPSTQERAVKAAHNKAAKPHVDAMVTDVGPAADWVKINVQRTKDCFEVYALVPGLLREEVRVQSDPAGRLVISGEPEQPDNPWGVTPFKKVVTLPSRIDPHQTSAVVTLHGQLFVRVPFDQSDL